MNDETKGDRAKRILEDEVFRQARAEARQTLFEEWERAPAPPQREALWAQLKALDRLPQALEVIRDRGVLAARENR